LASSPVQEFLEGLNPQLPQYSIQIA
jgi:hypothetical protein